VTCVLVIDADRAASTALQSLLEVEGFEVVMADSIDAGVNAIESAAFDAVIIDAVVPGVDGLDTIKRIHDRAPLVPIIALAPQRFRDSIGPERDFLTRATDFGATTGLYKPFMPRDLISAVATCLERKSQTPRRTPDSAWYRAQAAECAALAEKATDPLIKEFNQAEADRWLRLAEVVEKQRLS
jgi:DNA-binding response OmpR family regulator